MMQISDGSCLKQGIEKIFELRESEVIVPRSEARQFLAKLDRFDRKKALTTILEAYHSGALTAVEAISSLMFYRLLPKSRIVNPEAWMMLYAQIQAQR